MRHEIQREPRKAYWRHAEGLFRDVDDVHTPPIEKFWTYVNSIGTISGVSPLKENSGLVTDTLDQAELLNKQFKSGFSLSTGSSSQSPASQHAVLVSLQPLNKQFQSVFSLSTGSSSQSSAS